MMKTLPFVFLLLTVVQPAVAKSPNVIVILTDDQGWGDLGLHGNTNLKTPHIDSLAQRGARCDHFYVQPVCAPTRAEFLTGRWHPRGGVVGVSTGGERLNLTESTIADSFRASGYVTAAFGKWHNGSQYPYHPNGRGFDEYYGFTSGHWGDYFSPPLDHNGQAVRGEGFIADDLTNKAIAFSTTKRDQPFFCYLAFNTPHSPMQVPDEYWNRFKSADLKFTGDGKENLDHTRAALAMCENLDANIGRLLKSLDDAKLADDTIIVYFHDNGPNGRRWNGGMKGTKGSTDEGGVRSPLFIRWPGKIKAGTRVEAIAGAIDLLPTLCDLAGVKRTGSLPIDGISLAPALLGSGKLESKRNLFSYWNGKLSVRSQTHRLDAAGQLYDLVKDPGQKNDIAKTDAKTHAELTLAAANWRKDVLGNLPKPDVRPFPVGYSAMPRTVLPARDGLQLGNVKRSANAPNCSYFTNWIDIKDSMTWKIAVNTAGTYEAILHYTCPETDIGSAIELGFGKAHWTGTIAKAHDPKLYGANNDRVPRVGESYMKEFATLSLGEVNLSAGTDTLILKATKIPGKSVADIRAVELILKPESK